MATKNELIARQSFSAFVNAPQTQKAIMNTLGDTAKSQKFTAAVISAVTANPQLKNCMPNTILTAALLGESLNLSPSPTLGRYYMVPFANKNNPDMLDQFGNVVLDANGRPKKVQDAMFILGYKGYIELAIRSGAYKKITAVEIREGEYLGLDDDFEPMLKPISDDVDRLSRPVVGYMAKFTLVGGFEKTLFWSKEKMKLHANRYSSAFDIEAYNLLQAGKVAKKDEWKYSSYWYKDFDGMALKTMLRQLISKWGVMSVELQQAFDADNAVIKDDGSYEYVDNPENGDLNNDNNYSSAVIDNQKNEQIIKEYEAMTKVKLTPDEIEQVLLNNKVISYKSFCNLAHVDIVQTDVLMVLEKGYHNTDVFELQEIVAKANNQ